MHAATEVHQTARPLDQRRQHVRSERVDGKDGRMSLGCRGSARRGICAGVVDDGVHTADRIQLVRDASRFDGAGKVADDDTGRAGGKISSSLWFVSVERETRQGAQTVGDTSSRRSALRTVLP